jgi:ADP-ribose pyrophosphatase YjhB (NUDIX family)
MVEQQNIEHHIQKHVLSVLMHQRYGRFRDMRPPKADTNLYSYHLKLLMKRGFVEKTESGYTLGVKGMMYVDRINASTVKLSIQPKIITMLVIQNGYGDVLLYEKVRQPFIERWTVPFGKVHNDDASIAEAAQRELREKVGALEISLRHAGDAYIRVRHQDDIIVSSLAHIFHGTTDEPLDSDTLRWFAPQTIDQLDVAPAIKQVIARTYFNDPYFFEEYDEELLH